MNPAGVRIDDLARPRLDAAQRAAIEAAEARPVTLTVESVLETARLRSGLDDFGPMEFTARLAVWLEAVDEDPGHRAIARAGVFEDCVRYATNRARLERLWREHPEIDEVRVRAPIVIAGLPRSGTTHLVNLIAADRRLRSLPYWESREPVPDHREPDGSPDPRLVRCREASAGLDAMLPLLRAMHHMTPEHVHEEIELEAIDFSSYILEWNARVPRWRDHYLAADETPHYAYMRRVLATLQWLGGPDRWVLKSPQHMEQLPVLCATFPDATYVLPHRDPTDVIASTATMMAYGDRLRRRRVDPVETGAYWCDRIGRILDACVRDRDVLPAAQTVDLPFDEFVGDELGAVERIYRTADLEMDDDARRRLVAYRDDNPRGKKGRIAYDLEADFGLRAEALRERFTEYRRRFGLAEEGTDG